MALLFLLMIACILSSCSPALIEDTQEEQATSASSEGAEAEQTKTAVKEGPDPAADDEMNVLLIGNSYSYYWTEELWGMMNAAGYQNLTVCNVYSSGCTFEQHWNWHLLKQSNYTFYTVNENGRKGKKDMDLRSCIAAKNWDVISLQQSNRYVYLGGVEAHRNSMNTHLPQLYRYLNGEFPKAKYYWLQSWAHELGYGVDTLEEQMAATDAFRVVAKEICQKYGFTNVPCGDAWELIRHDPMITEGGKTLTTRIYKNQADYDDLTHDGDVGGGQYLNACVWFEVLTGKSCVGNTYRPKYLFGTQDLSLSEDKIAFLQNTAHQAVANYYGADYAK